MRRLQSAWIALLRPLLSLLMSVVLVVESSPLLPAYATQLLDANDKIEQVAAGDANDKSEQGMQKPEEKAEVEPKVEAEETKATELDVKDDSTERGDKKDEVLQEEPEPSYFEGSLSQKYEASDGNVYIVTVDCDKDACVPLGTELLVSEPNAEDLQTSRDMTKQALKLKDDDRILLQGYLDISLVADGHQVEPLSKLDITVETNAIAASRSATTEVVLVPRERVVEDNQVVEDEQLVAANEDAMADELVVAKNEDEELLLTSDAKDAEPQAADSIELTTEEDAKSKNLSKDLETQLKVEEVIDEEEPETVDATELLDENAQPLDEDTYLLGEGKCVTTKNLSSKDRSKYTKLGFRTSKLGIVSIASVVGELLQWQEPGFNLRLLGPRYDVSIDLEDADVPKLEAGVTAQSCTRVSTDPSLDFGTTLWFEAEPLAESKRQKQESQVESEIELGEAASSDADDDEIAVLAEDEQAEPEELGGTFAFLTRDGELGKQLCGPEGTTKAVPFRADKDDVLLAWDSGYRNVTLDMRNVTVEGMAPQDTEGTARNVSKHIDDPITLLGSVDQVDRVLEEQIESGTYELSTLVAYDIALESQGNEYEPDDEHPLKVTIKNEDIQKGKDLQLWHILDDGTTEAVEDFRVLDGAIVFTAAGFSTYAVTELRATPTDTTSLSTNFILKAVAKTYTRSSVVTFVDTDSNPIMGTVVGTRTITYTQEGDPANDTNSVDMYDYSGCLDPAIADEYDFSRVYLGLAQSQQKDFRYVFVADDKMIGENRTPPYYRAYFYMTSIDQNRSGQEYYGTWYLLSNGGAMDKVFIEFYHVALASFRAVDTRGDAVEGAEFTLYSDSNCYTPFEYKHEVVKATSNKRGVVSFGKIPRGTYYMKETVVPDGYKKSTKVRTIVVDGETAIDDVVHSDDDGSAIINDARDITFTKKWEGNEDDYEDYSVIVTVVTNDEVVAELKLNKKNDWTQTLEGLDPNTSYEITESSVLNGQGTDVLHDWIPTIESEVNNTWVEYQKAEEFIKGKDYVLVANGKALTAVSNSTSLIPTAVTVSGSMLTSAVTSNMLWEVTALTKDGVMTLQNVGTKKYLDENASSSLKWYQNTNEPQFVRHQNDNGTIYIYYRENINATTSIWLYMVDRVDRSGYFIHAAPFTLYREVNVKNYNVTITNKPTTYPVKMRNVHYPSDKAFPNTEFSLYTEESYTGTHPTPLMESLVANEEGYLEDGSSSTIHLRAGTYYLVRTSDSDGYLPVDPLRFTITRKGALRVQEADRAILDYEYSSTVQMEGYTYPLLKIPNYKPANLEVLFEAEGDYADLTRGFDFELALSGGMTELKGYVNGVATTFYSDETNEFQLAHGQSLVLRDVPEGASFTLTQTSSSVAASADSADGQYVTRASVTSPLGTQSTVTLDVADGDARVLSFSGILGTVDDPAQVTIVNALANEDVPATGINDNEALWSSIVIACGCALLALWWMGRRRREGNKL